MENLIHLVIGAFLIGIGFLVKANPMAIAGYNTMSEEKRKNVDIEGLSSLMKTYLIGMGIILIIGGFVFHWIGWKTMAGLWPIVSVVVPLPFMLIQAQKYDHNKKSPTKLLLTIAFIVVLFTGIGGYLFGSTVNLMDIG